MLKFTAITLLAAAAASLTLFAEEVSPGKEVYEMRVYYAAEGKLDALHARFRDHTMGLFEKHGIKNVGYFVPEGANPERKLVYFIKHASRDARTKSFRDFGSDPDWQKAAKESEKDGRLVTKIEESFLIPTDYSPTPKIEKKGDRIFELRTYTTPEGKLENLNSRFRDHTLNLFKKHGMENIIYWTKMPDQKDANTTLVYLLAHKNKEARDKSFDAFRQDPDWVKAKTESEKNGSLTVDQGVKSEILVPTDYSPLK
jgi:hypothetical protein